jgi:hypothetical protein
LNSNAPTKEQIGQIVALLVAEKVTFDEAQEFILAHRHQTSQKKSGVRSPGAHEVWEREFPGKGAEIMSILAPFYGWKPQLKYALPELRRRAKEAVFWKRCGVNVSRASEAPELHSWGSLWETVKEQYLYNRPDYCPLANMLDRELFNQLRETMRDPARTSLKASLMVPCMLILEDKPDEADGFRPLVDLWLEGNFPIGFDSADNLVVLVAE